VIHGYKTIFPIPLGEACSWDLAMMEQTARIAAIEAASDGINWTFAPMVDISRDAAGDVLWKEQAKIPIWEVV